MSRQDGTFRFDAGLKLSITEREDDFGARQLLDEIRGDFGVQVRMAPRGSGARVLIGRVDGNSAIDAALFTAGLAIPEKAADQGYALIVTPESIVVGARGSAGVFYGVQTLRQLIRANGLDRAIPCCRIVDWPALRYRAWQNDISRGPIPSMDTLKREIKTLSEYKLNAFTLYTEHVFKLKKHPAIAPKDGLTAEQVRELEDFAKPYHVEVWGNFQSFGHFANILKVPGYADMGENDSVLSPAKEKAYSFLADVYSEVAPAYDSPLFVINCDETYGIGEGAAKDIVAKMGVDGVYAYHISRVAELLKPYGKTPMMWGDIALRNPGIIAKLPKDVIALSWGYDPRPDFNDAIIPFVKLGLKFMVCPGVNCWSEMWPDMDAAAVNVSNYVRDGAKNGALGMINTCWDDDGENLLNYCWYPLVWGGECAWNPAVAPEGQNADTLRDARRATFDAAFASLYYGLPNDSVTKAILSLSRLRSLPASAGLFDGAFWRDPVESAVRFGPSGDGRKLREGADAALAAFSAGRRQARFNGDSLEYAEFAAQRIGFLGDTIEQSQSRSADLARSVDKLKSEYVRLWNLENRPWWLDQNLARYDSLQRRLAAVPYRVALTPNSSDFQGSINVSMKTLSSGGVVRFTTDGSEPTAASPEYTGPFAVSSTSTVKAAGFWPGGIRGETAEATYHTWRLPARIETTIPTNADNMPMRAFDGSETSYFWSAGDPKEGDTFTLILDRPTSFSSVRVLTGCPDHPEDYAHDAVIEVSADGKEFKTVAEFKAGIAEATLSAEPVKAVRLRLTKPAPNWLAIREIVLK